MKKQLSLLLILFAAIGGKSQNLIAVQHAGTPTFFTKLPDAISNSLAGDTVYIPGGSFDAITINKKLTLIGVGHNPDSTKLTGRTIIPQITLATGADNGSMTGIYFPATINSTYGNYNTNIAITSNLSGYTISRCNFYVLRQSDHFDFNNFSINECIINTLNLFPNSATNINVSNNIFLGNISFSNTTLNNNLFLPIASNTFFLGSSYCTIQNNIFEQFIERNNTNDSFNNNLNGGINDAIGAGYNNQGSGNFISSSGAVTLGSVFVQFDSAKLSGDDIYTNDFKLTPNSPYKNAGTDGTDIGIYGGAFPWKQGSVPLNPHPQKIKIAPKTDASGNLKVQITVAAQDN